MDLLHWLAKEGPQLLRPADHARLMEHFKRGAREHGALLCVLDAWSDEGHGECFVRVRACGAVLLFWSVCASVALCGRVCAAGKAGEALTACAGGSLGSLVSAIGVFLQWRALAGRMGLTARGVLCSWASG